MARFQTTLATALALSVCALPLTAQDDKKKPDPEIEEKLEEFDDAIRDRKFEKDAQAVKLIDELLEKGPDYHKKDRRDLIKGLGKVFGQRPRKPEQPQLYKATIAALGDLGGHDAASVLQKAYNTKLFDDNDWQPLREELLENIGKTKDTRMIEFLLDNTKQPDNDGLLRAAGRALRHFEGESFKQRREIFEKLQIEYARIESLAKRSVDPGDALRITFERRLTAVRPGWNETLSALTGQKFRTAEEWQKWWNDHKNKPKDWK